MTGRWLLQKPRLMDAGMASPGEGERGGGGGAEGVRRRGRQQAIDRLNARTRRGSSPVVAAAAAVAASAGGPGGGGAGHPGGDGGPGAPQGHRRHTEPRGRVAGRMGSAGVGRKALIERANNLAQRVDRLASSRETTATAMSRLTGAPKRYDEHGRGAAAQEVRSSLPKLGEPGHPDNRSASGGSQAAAVAHMQQMFGAGSGSGGGGSDGGKGLLAGTAAAVAGLNAATTGGGGPQLLSTGRGGQGRSLSAESSQAGQQQQQQPQPQQQGSADLSGAEKVWGHSAVTELRMRIREVAVERGAQPADAGGGGLAIPGHARGGVEQQQQQQHRDSSTFKSVMCSRGQLNGGQGVAAASQQPRGLGNLLGMTVTSYTAPRGGSGGGGGLLAQPGMAAGGWRIPSNPGPAGTSYV